MGPRENNIDLTSTHSNRASRLVTWGRELSLLAYGCVIIYVTSPKQFVNLESISLQTSLVLHFFDKRLELVNVTGNVHDDNSLGKIASIASFSPRKSSSNAIANTNTLTKDCGIADRKMDEVL